MKTTVLHRAMCVTGSWARSWGLKTSVKDGHLVVAGRTVSFRAGTGDVALSASRILDMDYSKVEKELSVLAEALDFEPPRPVRGISKGHVAKQGDHEARSLRLTAFARAPNPPTADIVKRLPLIKREADCAFRRYSFLAKKMGFTPHDFLDIGMTYTVVYLHRKADIFNAKSDGGRLTKYLRQEFARWAQVSTSDLRSIVPETGGCQVSDFMGSPVPGATLERTSTSGYYTIPEYAEPETAEVEPTESPVTRRARAKATLVEKLGAMPHDRMLDTLDEVSSSPYQDTAARTLAHRLLRKHKKACPLPSCRPAPTPAVG